MKSHSVSVSPSIKAWVALRKLERDPHDGTNYFGVGDPIFPGEPIEDRDVFRQLRSQLGPVFGSEEEIVTVAANFKEEQQRFILREMATEDSLQVANLTNLAILHFATHGLTSDELLAFVPWLNEPALVLSSFPYATKRFDGFLTSSEVARMTIDANWVILSACKTAAPDGAPDADGFSGLIKAFLSAGARNVVASHWTVYGPASSELVVGMTAWKNSNPDATASEALTASMRHLLNQPPDPKLANLYPAHPAFWAPFVVVGGPNNSRK